jgi:hypothetical protein
MPDGAKYWRLRYRFGGKRQMIQVGRPYPQTTLKAAKAKALEYQVLISKGTDPIDKVKTDKLVLQKRVANTLHSTAVVPIPLDPARAAQISSVFQRMPNPAR